MYKNFLVFISFIFFVSLGSAQEDYTLMFYNLLNYPEAPPSNREVILKQILEEVQPDIFMVCELQNEVAANSILTNALNDIGDAVYTMPNFIQNTSSGNQDLQQHIYFDESKFSLNFTDVVQTQLRDINYYQLELLNTPAEETIYLDIFVAHLKASQGINNELIRSNMVNDFTTYLSNLPDDANVIFAGDFNFYTANESAFLQLVMGQSNILFTDPINAIGDWNNNINFNEVHTQSTRTSNNNFDDFGAGGGMDDRFDFIMVSNTIMNEENSIAYKQDSYKAYGNNGNCFNKNISDTSCVGEFSQNTRNLLYNMSDHLPVVMEITNTNTNLSNQDWASSEIITFLNGNVVEDHLQLQFNLATSLGKHVFIYNSLGKVVREFKVSSFSEKIDLSNLAQGVYLLKINDSSETFRFIKQ